ncbi:Lrp/AsnC family transcriptional regulator [Candidatus Woesearchaeota archaeon]|nr:Lrp/AsnC family transcriptional regulator [Candidatus Woesearchaeota archaeon]
MVYDKINNKKAGSKKDTDNIGHLDRKILNVLLDNCRFSYRQIAKKVNISAATVMHHIEKLEKEGIIKKYSALLNSEKLGYDVQVIIDIRISKGKLFLVEKKIASHPNICAIYDTTGHFDAAIIAKFKTRRQMDDFLKLVQSYDFVERTETRLILNIIKESNLVV